MADISNRTLAILIVAILVTSLLSTWLILSQRSVDLSFMSTEDATVGVATFAVDGPAKETTNEGSGQAAIVVLPQEVVPVEATPSG